MAKRIPALQLRHELGNVLNSVHLLGEEYIVERNGKPLAALVPVDVALRREQARKRRLELMNARAPRSRMSDEAVSELVNREIHDLRRRRRKAPA
ncbi:MAG: hypothetical protein DMG57_38030 [Acidobacteria bacterium]|nr:MAG: hypothetical protein DMG57_38030 [Acidobacteriota bacterium]